MLIVKCSGCQSKIKLKEQFAGKRIKCPKCQASVQVPAISEELVPLELVRETVVTEYKEEDSLQPEPPNSAPVFNQPLARLPQKCGNPKSRENSFACF